MKIYPLGEMNLKQKKINGQQQKWKMLLYVLMFPLCMYAQDKVKVTGRVTGENNQPLATVSVVEKGSSTGTLTDEKGSFIINVSKTATLVFSSLNYVTQEVKVNGRASIDVVLVTSKNEIDAVVVVGYGTQRKRDVTGSVVTIGEKALREVPVANLQQALQGRAAGLEVQRVGTRPGAGAVIRIRGERTINGSNDPLIILDGVPL
jgi:hypothetical protein